MPSDMPHFKLRLPQALLDRVKAAAAKEKRTATGLIVEIIEDALDQSDRLQEARDGQQKIAAAERDQRAGLITQEDLARIVHEAVRVESEKYEARLSERMAALEAQLKKKSSRSRG